MQRNISLPLYPGDRKFLRQYNFERAVTGYHSKVVKQALRRIEYLRAKGELEQIVIERLVEKVGRQL